MEPAPRTRRRRPNDRPDEILDAALCEFGACGLAGARVSDIAARAGVAKGTIYLYFKTKSDLVRGVVLRTVEEAVASLREAAVGDTPRDRLVALLPALWAFFCSAQFHTVSRLIYAELNDYPDLTQFYSQEIAGKISSVIAGLIDEGVKEGQFRTLDPGVAARMLLALCVKHAMWLSRPDLYLHLASQPPSSVLDDIQEFFFAAIERT
ncbi:MAG: TetR/AcrR family transcriptional regulator [Rhodothermales bacterium]